LQAYNVGRLGEAADDDERIAAFPRIDLADNLARARIRRMNQGLDDYWNGLRERIAA